mmetsp:Transcript_27984/g.42669  ORF Transcript_27984/g.42669 Transcript_27984/m.42669 type:complete len:238 (+) Transcript_27984:58-771(+)|eukprot:CAMPEP_0194199530 /NCGR_PEP_ID=MMETSP0156-20130528/516_1 /TAXON_ID=33649 /ORGANISM="Thalassionema nitzschioides, Strain L26-B" /LENGTH=237 /DNA_ID=CAMNT_0038924439 /DNA_START=107 /DNA_END=820 /DNA_ORIENTATION=-
MNKATIVSNLCVPSPPFVNQGKDEKMLQLHKKKQSDKKVSMRPYQSEKWQQYFYQLLDFRRNNGTCLVPHYYAENIALARWVKRQRYQYNLRLKGKKSSITIERIRMLEQIGFIWDSHEAAWEERRKELEIFRAVNGTCSVPATCRTNPKLATWVKCQRRQYRLFCEGKPANISPERILELENLGFEWDVGRSSSSITSAKSSEWDIVMEKQKELMSSMSSDYELMSDVLTLLEDDN